MAANPITTTGTTTPAAMAAVLDCLLNEEVVAPVCSGTALAAGVAVALVAAGTVNFGPLISLQLR